MGKRNGKPLGLGWLILLGFMACAAAGSGAYYIVKNIKSKPKPVEHRRTIVVVSPDDTSSNQVSQDRKLVIFLPKSTDKGYYLVPVTRTTQDKGDILDAAVQVLLASSKQGGDSANIVPQGTRLLSPVKVKSGIATVDLSKEFVDNFSGGSDQEALTLNSIAHTLVNNSDGKVQKVQILVEGKTAESLGGHFDLTEPIAADSTLLKPGT